MAAVTAYIEEYCLRRAIVRSAALRLTLIVEELFTNSVLHGYGGEGDAPIWVGLSGAGDVVELCYEDAAPPYNPLEQLQQGHAAPVDQTVSGRAVGGLGVFLVAQLTHSARYAYLDGRNRLVLTVSGEA